MLGSFYGGLGDNLQLSTLPEEFFKQYKKVTYLSSKSNSRNNEIQELVWACNPFVKGIRSAAPTAGDFPQMCSQNISKGSNLISHWEKIHGLTVTNRFPKIYFEPKNILSLKNSILLDLTAVTLVPDSSKVSVNSYNPDILATRVKDYCNKFISEEILKVTFMKNLSRDKGNLSNTSKSTRNLYHDELQIGTIFDYVNAIYSCKELITIYSGAAVLASAIKQISCSPEITTFITSRNLNHEKENVNFIFDNVNYIELSLIHI